jgi:gamma-glutamylcyclotransferase (GGCT)/AIG2-like uncharacterized protein YtfP
LFSPEHAIMPDHLFVYGSLRPALAPSSVQPLLERMVPLGPASIPGRLYDLGLYPAALLDPAAETCILGEVFRLPDARAMLAALDAYEDFDPADPAASLYLRVRHPATLADGSQLLCWVYVYTLAPQNAVLIPDGDYVRWRTLRPTSPAD